MVLLTLLVTVILVVSPALSSQLGEPCQDDYDCARDQQECIKRFEECETKACFCKPDYGGRFSTSCHKEMNLTERCYDRPNWMVCPDESLCIYKNLDRCVPYIRAGASCSIAGDSTSCVSGAKCSTTTSTCTCQSHLKRKNGLCVQADFGEVCSSVSCKSDYHCLGSPSTCQCLNSTYSKLTYSENSQDVTTCIHDQAVKVELGGACRIGITTNYGRICNTGLTCSRCLAEDATTCITPGGGADGLKTGFFIVTAASLLMLM